MQIKTTPFLISLAALSATELTAMVMISTNIMPPMFALSLIRVAEIILFILIFQMWEDGVAALGLARDQILPGLWRGILWSAGFGVIVSVAFGIIFLLGKNPFKLFHAPLPRETGEFIFFLMLRGLIGPIAEEIFFRGILYGFLRRWGVFLAIFLSSLIFLLAHPFKGFPQMMGGLLFALSYEVERKLMVPMTIHVLGNMAIFGVSVIC